jgi:hypothetical protein
VFKPSVMMSPDYNQIDSNSQSQGMSVPTTAPGVKSGTKGQLNLFASMDYNSIDDSEALEGVQKS